MDLWFGWSLCTYYTAILTSRIFGLCDITDFSNLLEYKTFGAFLFSIHSPIETMWAKSFILVTIVISNFALNSAIPTSYVSVYPVEFDEDDILDLPIEVVEDDHKNGHARFLGEGYAKRDVDFLGMRGKKSDGVDFFGMRGKKAAGPDFLGMRGKKDGPDFLGEFPKGKNVYYKGSSAIKALYGTIKAEIVKFDFSIS